MPNISVIIPVFNGAQHIQSAIESVLSQTFQDFELIVVDDGSTDDTDNILGNYGNRIKSIKQSNQGVANARNAGLKLATGKYIALLDSDDMWVPEKLEKSLEFLEKGNFDWICTSRNKITEKGEKSERKIEPESGIYDSTGKMNNLEIGLFNLNYILAITSSVLIKKSCFDIAGLFDGSLRICEDMDLWLRFKEAGLTGGYLDEPLTIKRSHALSLSKNKPFFSLESTIKVARKHARILHLDKAFRGKIYSEFWWEIALSYYLNGSQCNAIKYSLVSFYFYPNATKLFKMLKYGLSRRRGG
jgi:glycosyltransferase involved in cell wall biosynthesis